MNEGRLLGAYYAYRTERPVRMEVALHVHDEGCACEGRGFYEIRWADGLKVTIESGREDTIREYLRDWKARSVHEILATA